MNHIYSGPFGLKNREEASKEKGSKGLEKASRAREGGEEAV